MPESFRMVLRNMNNTLLEQFLKKPLTTGAVCASSESLAKELTDSIGLETAVSAAELGPGTGAVTKVILGRIPEKCRFFTVELNPDVIQVFQQNFPAVTVYNDSAANLPELIRRENLTALDAVISGLPWAVFPDGLQEQILSSILQTLRPGGCFTTFAYLQGLLLPSGMHFRKRIENMFSKVEKSPVVWNNFPPAFVYRCRK